MQRPSKSRQLSDHAIDQITACQNKNKLSISWFILGLNESLCTTVKWHRVPVLSHRWCIGVHLAEQAMIIQLASKSSHSGIAQEMFWDI